MSVNKIDGETQLGCAPMLGLIGLAVLLWMLAHETGDHAKRLDAIEKALAAKEAGK